MRVEPLLHRLGLVVSPASRTATAASQAAGEGLPQGVVTVAIERVVFQHQLHLAGMLGFVPRENRLYCRYDWPQAGH